MNMELYITYFDVFKIQVDRKIPIKRKTLTATPYNLENIDMKFERATRTVQNLCKTLGADIKLTCLTVFVCARFQLSCCLHSRSILSYKLYDNMF